MITEVNINKVEAKREHRDMISNMKFNINFDDVKVEKENVNVAFTFTTDYEGQETSKNVGKLEIKGTIVAKENKKDTEEITAMWKDKKTLPVYKVSLPEQYVVFVPLSEFRKHPAYLRYIPWAMCSYLKRFLFRSC